MERQVPFLKRNGNIIAHMQRHQAEHVESLRGGLAVIVTSAAYFVDTGHIGRRVRAFIEISIVVSHFGQPIKTVESGSVPFDLLNGKKFYAESFLVSIGGQKLEVGFAGTSVSHKRDNWGRLPKYMYIKIESVAPAKK